ncbi:TIGR04222 domain-containing membrane protein [Allokutzneria multivorans]
MDAMLWSTVLVGSLGWAFLTRFLIQIRSTSQYAQRVLTPTDLAYLAGGPRRVVEVCVVRLHEVNALRLPRTTGQFKSISGSLWADPVEELVLDRSKSAISLRGLSNWIYRSDKVKAVRDRLVEEGLANGPAQSARARRAVYPAIVVHLLAFVMLFLGETDLIFLPFFGLAMSMILLSWKLPLRTSAGKRALHSSPAVEPLTVNAVIYGGIGAHPVVETRRAIRKGSVPSTESGAGLVSSTCAVAGGYSCGSSCGSSSSSSCGSSSSSCGSSSSSCGGGGGGCGGGGGGS